MYAGNKTAPVKGNFSHNGTWENIAGYKFVGLLEISMEMPMALFGVVSIKFATLTQGDNTSGCSKQFKLLRYIVHAFMLRRTKALLVKNGTLTLPPLSGVTVLAPLVPFQKKIYVSVFHQELPSFKKVVQALSINPYKILWYNCERHVAILIFSMVWSQGHLKKANA